MFVQQTILQHTAQKDTIVLTQLLIQLSVHLGILVQRSLMFQEVRNSIWQTELTLILDCPSMGSCKSGSHRYFFWGVFIYIFIAIVYLKLLQVVVEIIRGQGDTKNAPFIVKFIRSKYPSTITQNEIELANAMTMSNFYGN